MPTTRWLIIVCVASVFNFPTQLLPLMRIVLVRRGYSPTGGAERYLCRLADTLANTGHQPDLVTSENWPKSAWQHGEIHRLPGKNPLVFAEALQQLVPTLNGDRLVSLERVWACDAYRAGDGVHAAWLDRRAAYESPWKSHFRRWQTKHRMLLQLESALFSGAAGRIIVNSKMVAEEISQYYHTPAEKIHLVYNGYDLPSVHTPPADNTSPAAIKRAYGIPEDATMVLFTGSGWERKGLAHAIAALKMLKHPKVHLLVAGVGKTRAEYRHSHVHFCGPVQDMPPLLRAADVFILPTLYDPFSNACLEAACHGLPVITTDANGCAEILTEGIHGSITRPGDIAALSAALEFWASPGRAAAAKSVCALNAARFSMAANVEATIKALL